jgi:cytosine deaminase
MQAAEAAIQVVARSKNAVLGVFVFDQPEKRQWLTSAFQLATAYDLPLDFHVDEGLGDGLDGLEIIADLVLSTKFARPVLCGHACSLSTLTGIRLERALASIAAAQLSIVSLPTTNLYLQDRQAGSPQRRGLTRLRELATMGVPLAIGSDNVADAFCPLGAHDPLAALAIAALAAHLDPPYGQWLPTITTTARRAIGLPPRFIDQTTIADLLVSEARHTAYLVAGSPHQPLLKWAGAQR